VGVHKNITADTFPKQSDLVNKRVLVFFHYDTRRSVRGTVVRDDREPPFETIIRLDDGRVVRTAECQYALER
jgi:hypothetical protein